jgi:predicted MFS family arabinose efflux permease
LGGGILTLLPVFGEKIFPVAGSAAVGLGVLYAARGIGTAVGPVLTRRFYSETRQQMQRAIGFAFILAGIFYVSFGTTRSFALALLFLCVAHMGGSILWVFSTVLLQSTVEDEFRGRVFAAELMLMTLAMAASNYFTGEALDRLGYSPRTLTAAIGLFFTLPGLLWFITRRRWDRDSPRG